MLRNALIALGIVMLTAGPSFARSLEKAPPPPPYQKVSTLVPLPNFLPGIGTLYVNSKTLPEGPYLAYDHQGHEQAGMVGRLIVGKAIGPGTLPFDYFKALGKHWLPVPAAAQKAFPSIAEILQRKVEPSPLNFST